MRAILDAGEDARSVGVESRGRHKALMLWPVVAAGALGIAAGFWIGALRGRVAWRLVRASRILFSAERGRGFALADQVEALARVTADEAARTGAAAALAEWRATGAAIDRMGGPLTAPVAREVLVGDGRDREA